MKEVMTVDDAASLLAVHPQTIRKWLRNGEITGADTPAGWRLTPVDIEVWLDKNRPARPSEPDATTHLMSSPVNAARLTQAINDHRAGRNMQERELLPDVD